MKDALGHGSNAHNSGIEASVPSVDRARLDAQLIAYHTAQREQASRELMRADYGSTRKLKGLQNKIESHNNALKILMGQK